MAAHKRTRFERERDLEKAARSYCLGKTQREIAEELGVSRVQITHDLAEVRKRWQVSSVAVIDERKAEQLAKIDNLERVYWESFERSCEDKEVDLAEKTSVVGDPDRTKASKRREGQSGNPAFLAGVQWCIEQRCKILGLEAKKDGTALVNQAQQIVIIENVITAPPDAASAPPESKDGRSQSA